MNMSFFISPLPSVDLLNHDFPYAVFRLFRSPASNMTSQPISIG